MTAHISRTHAAGSQTHHQAPSWSVKGIAPHTREAVKEAARRSGMTIGEWLSAAITCQAQAEPEGERPPAIDDRWAEVAAHLAQLVRRDARATPTTPPKQASAREAAPPEVSLRAIERSLREAEARAVRREQLRAARLAEALTGLARYIDKMEQARAEEARNAALRQTEATEELSHALAEVAQYVERIDARLAASAQTAAPPPRRIEDEGEQAERLASRLLPAMEQRLATSLREIVDNLTRTTIPALSAGHPKGEQESSRPDAEQLAVEDRLARAIADIRAKQVELARLEAQDDDEGQRAIIERLEMLSRKLDDALRPAEGDAPHPALNVVLERLDRINSRLEEGPAAPGVSRIEDMVRHLSENVEALHRDGTRTDARASEADLDTLAAQIGQLAERLEYLTRRGAESSSDTSAESRSHLKNLEAAIGTLSVQMQDLSGADEATLERVARTAAREALDALLPEGTAPRTRSEDALDTVHNTLERIVDRLALIEDDIRASGVGLHRRGADTPSGDAGGNEDPARPELRAAQALSRAFPPPTPEELSPGTDGPENLLARDSGGLTENLGFTASFIAAARRAAMAAADETRQKPTVSQTDEPSPQGEKRRRSLLIGLGALIAATGAAQVAATLTQGATRLS